VTDEGQAEKSGRERRRFTRVALDAQVRVNVIDTEALFDSRIRDLSENGVFILTKSTRPVGTGIQLAIVVRQGDLEVRAKGVIVHEVKAEEATPDRPAGIGVMFTDVETTTTPDLERLMDRGVPLP
jgi:Tfp pilus assembly protein PilZ